MLEITDLLERFPPSISGGAQQRVSLARALIRNAAVHLLDEPMSQLEPQLRALLRARIKDYLIAHKMTTVDRHSRPDRGDCSGRPHRGDGEGRVAAVRHTARSAGTARQLVRRVVHWRAADELIPRRRARRKIAVLNERKEVAFHMPLVVSEAIGEIRDGKRIMVGVRPHRIHLAPAGQVKGATLMGEVSSNHWLGDHSQIGFQVRGCLWSRWAAVTCRRRWARRFQ